MPANRSQFPEDFAGKYWLYRISARLSCVGRRTESIDGMEGLTNLTPLDLSSNKLTDVHLLGRLTAPEALDLGYNDVRDRDCQRRQSEIPQLRATPLRSLDVGTPSEAEKRGIACSEFGRVIQDLGLKDKRIPTGARGSRRPSAASGVLKIQEELMKSRITDLAIRITHQEAALKELSQAVLQQLPLHY